MFESIKLAAAIFCFNCLFRARKVVGHVRVVWCPFCLFVWFIYQTLFWWCDISVFVLLVQLFFFFVVFFVLFVSSFKNPNSHKYLFTKCIILNFWGTVCFRYRKPRLGKHKTLISSHIYCIFNQFENRKYLSYLECYHHWLDLYQLLFLL